MSGREILYLSYEDIKELDFGMDEIVRLVERAFGDKAKGDTEMPPKPGIHPAAGDAFIHAMPAYLRSMSAAGMKWVSGYPENFKRNLPYISGLIILNDPSTGVPISVMDATWITAMRTGAATGVAAKYLARPDSETVCIIGCGVQGRSNLEALHTIMGSMEEVRAYDTSSLSLQRYVEEMSKKFGVTVKPAKGPRDAIEGSDVIVTASPILKHPNPVIEKSWVKSGVFACPIDFDSYWKPEAMHFMDKFCTDDTQQIGYYKSVGYFQDIPKVYADLGELIIRKKAGRENDKERIMSMNLGVAIEDIAVAARIYDAARRKGAGQTLPL